MTPAQFRLLLTDFQVAVIREVGGQLMQITDAQRAIEIHQLRERIIAAYAEKCEAKEAA